MIHFRNIRVSVYSDTLLRVEYQPQAQFTDLPTLLMGKEMPLEIKAEYEERQETLIVRTNKCELVYQAKSADFLQDILDVRYIHGQATKKWDRTLKHTHPVPEVYRSLDQWPQGMKRCAQPIIVNADGWHCIEDSGGVYWDNKWPVVKRRPHYYNFYLFFYGSDIEQAFRDFIHLFGKVPLLPRQVFGAWYSRWYDYKDHELIQLVEDYKKHDVPLDILVVDVDWHKHHWNGYDWKQESFANPRQFIDEIKSRGLKLVLNDHPGYDLCDPLPDDDSHLTSLKAELAEPPYKGMWACDWSKASLVAKWTQTCLQDLLRQGIDAWWIDGWGDVPFPDVDAQLWLNWQYYEAIFGLRPQRRALILSRWGGIGSHRYPVQFSGDTHATFATLQSEVEYTAYSGGLGACYWSHDIGGFHEPKVDEELYIRWVQFSSLTPMFRTHSNHGIREPFHFSAKALAIYKKYIHLHYRLIPYLEQLHFHNHMTGFPLVYPMYFSYPDAKEAYNYPEQYFLGKSVLIAPITIPIQNENGKVDVSVWLPEGEWLDLISGEWLVGGNAIIEQASLEQMPIFIRRGAIVPTMSVISPIPIGTYPEIIFHIFDFASRGEEIFYFDDGETPHNMDPKHRSEINISYHCRENQVDIHCQVDPIRNFLPQIITFVCYSKIPQMILRGKRQWPFRESCDHLLTDFAATTPHCFQWSIAKKEIPKSGILEFKVLWEALVAVKITHSTKQIPRR